MSMAERRGTEVWDAEEISRARATRIEAVVGGVVMSILFNQSRFAELVFYPYAVILQVTPIVSVAPLSFIYVQDATSRVLICAWIVAFFPILSNTTLGLKSTDMNLRDRFAIYGASRWQRLVNLHLPSALPYFLGGLRIAGGLALIGAIVAEYVVGVAIFGLRSFLSWVCLRKWHERAVRCE